MVPKGRKQSKMVQVVQNYQNGQKWSKGTWSKWHKTVEMVKHGGPDFKRSKFRKKGDRNVFWAVSCHSTFLWQLQRGNREEGGSVFVCIFDWTILATKNNSTLNWYGTNVTLYSGVFPGGILLSVRCHFFLNFDGWLWPLFAFQHSFQLVALLNHVCGTRKK